MCLQQGSHADLLADEILGKEIDILGVALVWPAQCCACTRVSTAHAALPCTSAKQPNLPDVRLAVSCFVFTWDNKSRCICYRLHGLPLCKGIEHWLWQLHMATFHLSRYTSIDIINGTAIITAYLLSQRVTC
jgi:hypothetical protein